MEYPEQLQVEVFLIICHLETINYTAFHSVCLFDSIRKNETVHSIYTKGKLSVENFPGMIPGWSPIKRVQTVQVGCINRSQGQ